MWCTDTKEWIVVKEEPGSSRRSAFCGIEEEVPEKPRKKKKGVNKAPFKDNANHTTIGNEFITGANKPRFYNIDVKPKHSVVDTIHTADMMRWNTFIISNKYGPK